MEATTPTSQKNSFLKRKKPGIIGVAALVVVVVVGWLIASQHLRQVVPTDLSSESGKVTVHAVHTGMKLRSGSPLSGSFKREGSAQVFYSVMTADNKMIGGGNMLANSDHTFSRNMEFSADKSKGKPGKLTVYLQDQQGKRIDSVSVDVILE